MNRKLLKLGTVEPPGKQARAAAWHRNLKNLKSNQTSDIIVPASWELKVDEPLAVSASAANPDYTRHHIYGDEVFPNSRVSPNMVHSPLLMFVWQMRSRSVTREGSFWEEGHCNSCSKNGEGAKAN